MSGSVVGAVHSAVLNAGRVRGRPRNKHGGL